jgi:membrane protease YdiL (CAAX protease family)
MINESAGGSIGVAVAREPEGSPETRRSLAVALGWYAAFMALHVALAWDGGRLVTTLLPGIGAWLGPVDWAIYALFAIVAATAVGWRGTGITRRPTRGWVGMAAVPIAAGLPFLLFGFNLEPDSVIPLLLVGTPLIALNEELFFRGVLLDVLRPLGWRSAVLWSAALFGASHLANLVAGASLPFTVMQVAATTAGGVALAAIRIRSGSLWPVLVVHVVLDVIAISTLTGPAVDSAILLPVLFAWLAANLVLWRFGWRLLAGRPDDALDRMADGIAQCPAAGGSAPERACPGPSGQQAG